MGYHSNVTVLWKFPFRKSTHDPATFASWEESNHAKNEHATQDWELLSRRICTNHGPVRDVLAGCTSCFASVFLSLCRMSISVFWGHERLTDSIKTLFQERYHFSSWKKVQFQDRFTLVTQDSIGCLKMLCLNVSSLAVAFESEYENATAHRKAIKKKKR